MNEATPLAAKFKSQIERSSGDCAAERRLLRGIPVIGGGHEHIAGTRPDQIAD